ncbi:MAG: MraY family glycosyltransferase [Patescibacteria group bacterium]|jgi:UDP-GlcNAc:undecaprenyl-phosphate GlcNAc-1-phosphate transferase
MQYLIGFSIALVLSLFLTGIARKIGIKYNIMSKPRKRDVHLRPMPRIGGPAIFVAFAVALFLVFLRFNIDPSADNTTHIFNLRIWGIVLGGLAVVGLNLFDDLKGLSPLKKLMIQVFAALVVIASGVGIDHLTNPFGPEINLNSVYVPIFSLDGVVYHFSLWSDLLTLIWLVGMMNIMNFVDGVDGLAGGLATIAAFILFLLSISTVVNQPSTAMIAIVFAGAVSGFLYWNFPPAKIFMGDSGSMFLGFMLGVLPLISGGKLATAFLVLGFPIIDGFVVAIGRIVRGKNPINTPDKTHIHHRFLGAGFSTRQSILAMYFIAAAFGWVALRSTTAEKFTAAGVLFLLVLLTIYLLTRFRRKRS